MLLLNILEIHSCNQQLFYPYNFTFTDGFGVRHVQAFLLFLCLSITYALRVNFSVAIVAMTDKNSTNPDFEVNYN